MVVPPDLLFTELATAAGKGDFKISEKRNRKNHEYDKEEQVQPDVGGNIIQDFRIGMIQEMKGQAEQYIDQENKKSIQ